MRIRTKLTATQVEQLRRDLPAMIKGRKPDKYRLRHIFWGAYAKSLFESVSLAYAVKSAGGTDDLGNEWPDISPERKAYRRSKKATDVKEKYKRRLRDKSTLGLLTKTEQQRWSLIFGRTYHRLLKKGVDNLEAKERAAMKAWYMLKAAGAKTKLAVFGNMDMPIMVDTGRLQKSLLPGKFNPSHGYSPKNGDQLYKVWKTVVRMGTNVPYASYHDEGVASVPRPVWPDDMEPWIEKATEDGWNAVYARLLTIMR